MNGVVVRMDFIVLVLRPSGEATERMKEAVKCFLEKIWCV